MKIALYSGGFWEGAFGNVVSSLCHALTYNGYKNIDIVYVDKGNPLPTEKFPSTVNFIKLPCKRALTSPFFLKKYLESERPDVFISMPSYMNIMAIVGKLISNWQGKLIITEHATMSEKIKEHKGSFVMGHMHFFARFFYKYADMLCAVSDDVISDLKTKIKLKSPDMLHIPNPVDIDLIRKQASEISMKNLHPWLAEKNGIPCFITVGRLEQQKNTAALLDSFFLVCQKIDARLLIIGDGSLRDELQLKIKKLNLTKVVELLGYHSNPYSFIKNADCFVLPSREEAFGLVLVESLALEVPIVATDAIGGGPRSVLANGKYGLLVEPDAPILFSEKMIEVVTDRNVNHNLIVLSDERADYYQPSKIGRQWKDLIQSLC